MKNCYNDKEDNLNAKSKKYKFPKNNKQIYEENPLGDYSALCSSEFSINSNLSKEIFSLRDKLISVSEQFHNIQSKILKLEYKEKRKLSKQRRRDSQVERERLNFMCNENVHLLQGIKNLRKKLHSLILE